MGHECTIHLRRARYLPNAGGGTIFCTVTYDSTGPALTFLHPGQFPEFEGEEAWFRAEQLPRKRFRFIRQMESKRG